MDLEKTQIDFKIKYYKNLIKYCQDNIIEHKFFENELEKCQSSKNVLTDTEKNNSIENMKFSEDYLYKKPWNKLNNIHKIIKIKEFIDKLSISDDDEVNQLKKQVHTLINNKILTKKDSVNYNAIIGSVAGIPILKHKNGKYYFNI
jgi:hypothetical protein